MEMIIKDLCEKMDTVIEKVTDELPASFPEDVARTIFDGMKVARERLNKDG